MAHKKLTPKWKKSWSPRSSNGKRSSTTHKPEQGMKLLNARMWTILTREGKARQQSTERACKKTTYLRSLLTSSSAPWLHLAISERTIKWNSLKIMSTSQFRAMHRSYLIFISTMLRSIKSKLQMKMVILSKRTACHCFQTFHKKNSMDWLQIFTNRFATMSTTRTATQNQKGHKSSNEPHLNSSNPRNSRKSKQSEAWPRIRTSRSSCLTLWKPFWSPRHPSTPDSGLWTQEAWVMVQWTTHSSGLGTKRSSKASRHSSARSTSWQPSRTACSC